MKTGKTLSLSMAVACLAFLTPQLARAQSMNAQAPDYGTATSTADPAAEQQASQMVPVNVHLARALDSKKAQPGTQFEAIVDSTVHLKDGTELPHGTVLMGQVATDNMRSEGTSRLALQFTEAKLKDGKTFPIRAMIAGITGPPNSLGYMDESQGPPAWNGNAVVVDELGALHDVDLHSRISGENSGVFVSSKKDDVKLAAGSQLSLAVAVGQNGMQNSGGA